MPRRPPLIANQLRLARPSQLLPAAESSSNMSVCSDVSDYDWLTGEVAAALLNELAASELPLHTAVDRLRRTLSPSRTHLVAELVELRRRALAKFSAADRMFFTRTTLEQATDEQTASYKASRIAQRAGSVSDRRSPLIADLCCGIGGDLLSLAEQGTVVATDSNPIATRFAAANVRAVVPSADVQFQTMDAANIDLADISAWHIDPDRRISGRRTTSLEACQPDLLDIERLLRQAPNAAIKLAPATKVPQTWAERCELEWISRGGECRQLIAWHGELAEFPGQRRATILPAAGGLAAQTLAGTPNTPAQLARQLSEYIFDIDPAVLAAHLKGALAAAHKLSALDTGPTYLTGDTALSHPALTCFQVDDILPLRKQSLAKHLRDRHIGQLEIKKRGVDIVPEKLRRELKLRGDNAATLLITKVAGRPAAIIAHRIS
jgi:hypothetical protein